MSGYSEHLRKSAHGATNSELRSASPGVARKGRYAASTARVFATLGEGATAGRLSDGRLFLQHGPINLVITIDGHAEAIAAAEAKLCAAFPHWLGRLVLVLPQLRTPAPVRLEEPADPIAAAMVAAVAPFVAHTVTPMAAVAGAIADAAIRVISSVPGIARAFVNNGGDIALHLGDAATFNVGIVSNAQTGAIGATVAIDASMAVRGVATSGWRGRSHSLGIADAVTVLAGSAAAADAAATIIASATDTSHAAVKRAPANTLNDDSDLRERLVTLSVGRLDEPSRKAAVDNGARCARDALNNGHIYAAAICVQGHWCFVGSALHDARLAQQNNLTLSRNNLTTGEGLE